MAALRDLLPRDKLDLERAEVVVALGYPAVAPLLPDMMLWLQDSNWPVCDVFAPFLATIGAPLVPEVRRVLESNDESWKYWVLLYIVSKSPAVKGGVRDQLVRIAGAEPSDEDEETHLLAKELLQE